MTPWSWAAVWRRLRPVLIAAAVFFAMAFLSQLAGLELAALFGGELFFYLEAVIAVWVAVGRQAVATRRPLMKLWVAVQQRRLCPRTRRLQRPARPPANDDDADPWPAFALAA